MKLQLVAFIYVRGDALQSMYEYVRYIKREKREKQEVKTWTLMTKINICSKNHSANRNLSKERQCLTRCDYRRVMFVLVKIAGEMIVATSPNV